MKDSEYTEHNSGDCSVDMPEPRQLHPTEERETLKSKWRKFARAKVRGLQNKTAAIEAGYSPASAQTRGNQLMRRPEIQREIRRLEEIADKQIAEDNLPSKNEVLLKVAEVMRTSSDERTVINAAQVISKIRGFNAPVKREEKGDYDYNYNLRFVGGNGGMKPLSEAPGARQLGSGGDDGEVIDVDVEPDGGDDGEADDE